MQPVDTFFLFHIAAVSQTQTITQIFFHQTLKEHKIKLNNFQLTEVFAIGVESNTTFFSIDQIT